MGTTPFKVNKRIVSRETILNLTGKNIKDYLFVPFLVRQGKIPDDE